MKTRTGARRVGSGVLGNLTMRALQLIRVYTMPAILIVLIAFFSVLAPHFFSFANIMLIFSNASITGILAVGMTFVLILGGIDLSVASNVTITTVVVSYFLVTFPVAPGLAVVISLIPGCLIGLLNGFLIIRARVPALIVTLGTASILQSIASFVTQGAITSLGEFKLLTFIGQGALWKAIPVPAILFIGLAVLAQIVLTKTPFGSYIQAIGGNRNAARLMGLQVERQQIFVYILSGFMAAISGIIVAGRLSMASSQTGVGLELPSIAAATLGGSLLTGGSGTVSGTVVGALILSVVFNGLILLGVPFFYQLAATGLILLLAVAFNEAVRKIT
jgi:ribose transport system permease protein